MNIDKDNLTAVAGVSADPEKFGYKIFTSLISAGWLVRGINPKGGEIAGQKIYTNLSEIEDKIDAVITVTPPAITEKIVEECIKLGIKKIWMQPGSSSDTAKQKAQNAGIEVIADACLMVKKAIW